MGSISKWWPVQVAREHPGRSFIMGAGSYLVLAVGGCQGTTARSRWAPHRAASS